jgi:hypothetical protein
MGGCVCRVCPVLVWHYIDIFVFGYCNYMVIASVVLYCILLQFLYDLELIFKLCFWKFNYFMVRSLAGVAMISTFS